MPDAGFASIDSKQEWRQPPESHSMVLRLIALAKSLADLVVRLHAHHSTKALTGGNHENR